MVNDDAMTDPVLFDLQGGVATITLNLPERKNSLGAELVEALATRLDQAVGDPKVRVIVLTNTGNTFCAGADLKSANPGADGNGRTFVDVFKIIMAAPKPVIGKIDGHATGGGVGLVAACDISVMRNDAKIGFTEVRLGVAPAVISVVCLPKLRKADANELFLTGKMFSPDKAAAVGLINQSVPPDELEPAVGEIVDMVMKGGPLALGATKELVQKVPGLELDEAFAWTGARSRELFQSQEAAAGIQAFQDRKPAPWDPAT